MLSSLTQWIHALTEGVKPFDWLMLAVEVLVLLIILLEFVWHTMNAVGEWREIRRRVRAIDENATQLLDASLLTQLREHVINNRRPSDALGTLLYSRSSIEIVERDYTGWKFSDENRTALRKWAKQKT